MESVSELSNACANEDKVLTQNNNDDDLKHLKEAIKEFRETSHYRQYWYHIGKKVVDQSNCATFLIPRLSDFEHYTSCLLMSFDENVCTSMRGQIVHGCNLQYITVCCTA